jgi:hypothetical protein
VSTGHHGGTVQRRRHQRRPAQRRRHRNRQERAWCAPIGGPLRRDEGWKPKASLFGARCCEARPELSRRAAEPEQGRAVGKNCGDKVPRLTGGVDRHGLQLYGLLGQVERVRPVRQKRFAKFCFSFSKGTEKKLN